MQTKKTQQSSHSSHDVDHKEEVQLTCIDGAGWYKLFVTVDPREVK